MSLRSKFWPMLSGGVHPAVEQDRSGESLGEQFLVSTVRRLDVFLGNRKATSEDGLRVLGSPR